MWRWIMLYDDIPVLLRQCHEVVEVMLITRAGWRAFHHPPAERDLYRQQAAYEQADLALVSAVGAETVRLGRVRGEHAPKGRRWCGGLGLHAGRDETERAVEEGDRCQCGFERGRGCYQEA